MSEQPATLKSVVESVTNMHEAANVVDTVNKFMRWMVVRIQPEFESHVERMRAAQLASPDGDISDEEWERIGAETGWSRLIGALFDLAQIHEEVDRKVSTMDRANWLGEDDAA